MATHFHGGRSWPLHSFLFDSPIEAFPAPAALAIPLWRGGRAVVSEGMPVAAQSEVGVDHDGLPVFTPLGGNVREIADFAAAAVRPARYNIQRLTMHIAAKADEAAPGPVFAPRPRFWEMTRGELAARLFAAGVIDLRGRRLPTTIVFDGLDPEPPLSTNLRLLMERPEELLTGMRIVMQIHGAVRARLAVPANQPALYARLISMLASSVNLHAVRVENRYPARHPALLPALAGLPRASAIYGMEDALRVRQAMVEGRPVTAKHVTLWDERSHRRRNLEVPLGTTVGQALGVDPAALDGCKIVLGGMLSGRAIHSLGTPVGRDTGGILLLRAGRDYRPAACLNCGQCLGVCPAGLAPALIHRLERDGGAGELRRLEPAACLDCGLCSYLCPAGLDLSHQVRLAAQATAAETA